VKVDLEHASPSFGSLEHKPGLYHVVISLPRLVRSYQIHYILIDR